MGLKLLNLRCRDAACLISASMDRRLTRMERLGLGIHLALCRICRRYRLALVQLRTILRELGPGQPREASLPETARARIRQHLIKQ